MKQEIPGRFFRCAIIHAGGVIATRHNQRLSCFNFSDEPVRPKWRRSSSAFHSGSESAARGASAGFGAAVLPAGYQLR